MLSIAAMSLALAQLAQAGHGLIDKLATNVCQIAVLRSHFQRFCAPNVPQVAFSFLSSAEEWLVTHC